MGVAQKSEDDRDIYDMSNKDVERIKSSLDSRVNEDGVDEHVD